MNFSFMRTRIISPKITIGNHELNEVVVFKLLGVMVQNDLKWNCHVNGIGKAGKHEAAYAPDSERI